MESCYSRSDHSSKKMEFWVWLMAAILMMISGWQLAHGVREGGSLKGMIAYEHLDTTTHESDSATVRPVMSSSNKDVASSDKDGLRLELHHVDYLVRAAGNKTTASTTGVERLKRATERSLVRARELARRAAAGSGSGSSGAPVSSDNGAYIVQLAVGTPAQTFLAIVDTGSDLVWRQASASGGGSRASSGSSLFDPSRSSTYRTLSCSDSRCAALPASVCAPDTDTCRYIYAYGDGSTGIEGALSADTLTIGGVSAEGFVFGAGERDLGVLEGSDPATGLVGMGAGPLSLPSQLAAGGGLMASAKKFSYCLVNWTDSASKTSPLFLGSRATAPSGSLSTPFAAGPHDTFYYLTLTGVSVGGRRVDIPDGTFEPRSDGSGGFVIDSGTTVSYLDPAAYDPVRRAYVAAIGGSLPSVDGSATVGLDLCYDVRHGSAASVSLPKMTLHLMGADLELPAENTFIGDGGFFCLAMMSSSDLRINILGNVQQQNFHFLYDKGSANQLSFQPANCDSL